LRISRWSRNSSTSARSAGRGKLPVWVVKIRSVLRFMLQAPFVDEGLQCHRIGCAALRVAM
jgi:hypothetical protein